MKLRRAVELVLSGEAKILRVYHYWDDYLEIIFLWENEKYELGWGIVPKYVIKI